MKKSIFILAAALMLVFAANGAFAQTPSVFGPTNSPVFGTTNGIFTSVADDFIDPAYYLDTGIEKWFAATAFGGLPVFGCATYVSGIYIGVIYQGNLMQGFQSFSYSEANIEFGGDDQWKQFRMYGVTPVFNDNSNRRNGFSVLVGIMDMGIKFTYGSNFQSFSRKNLIINGTDYYASYDLRRGWTEVSLEWAMAKDMLPEGIRPSAKVELGFEVDNTKWDMYTDPENSTEKTGVWEEGSTVVYPVITLDMGGYTFLEKDAISLSANLNYELSFAPITTLTYTTVNDDNSFKVNSYTGPYYDYDFDDTTFPGATTTTETKGTETGADHVITPSLTASFEIGKLSFGATLELPVTIKSNTTETKTESIFDYPAFPSMNQTGVATETVTKTSVEFEPVLLLGFQYQVNEKLTLFAGGSIGLSVVNSTTTTTVNKNVITGGTNSDTTTETKTHAFATTNTGGPNVATTFSAGFSFNLTDNLWLEANTGVNNFAGFQFMGNLTTFSNIMLGIKF